MELPSAPNYYEEATTDPDWQSAMEEEMQSIYKDHTWDLVDLPSGQRPICTKWVYKAKERADGSLHKCEARLVAGL